MFVGRWIGAAPKVTQPTLLEFAPAIFEVAATNLPRAFVQRKLCKYWSSPSDLGAKVSRSITQLMKYPAAGWIKASNIPSQVSADKVLRLKGKIEGLEGELSKLRTERPAGTDHLATGSDATVLQFTYAIKSRSTRQGRVSWPVTGTASGEVVVTWDQVIAFIGPRLITGAIPSAFRQLIDKARGHYGHDSAAVKHTDDRISDVVATDETYRRILVQLRALGLLAIDSEGYTEKWFLTPYGDDYMTKLLAETKAPNQRLEPTADLLGHVSVVRGSFAAYDDYSGGKQANRPDDGDRTR